MNVGDTKTEEHTFSSTCSYDSNYHYYVCVFCDGKSEEKTHTWENGTCICGATNSSSGGETTCTHENVKYENTGTGTHKVLCAVCENYIVKESEDCTANQDSERSDMGLEDVHSVTCQFCYGTFPEAHQFSENKCSLCGYEKSSACNHTNKVYSPLTDEWHQWLCDDCNDSGDEECTFINGVCVCENTACTHSTETYVPIDTGKHKIVCGDCDTVLTEEEYCTTGTNSQYYSVDSDDYHYVSCHYCAEYFPEGHYFSGNKCTPCGYEKTTSCETHTWNDATCTEPKTCSVCGATDGIALGHDISGATCTEGGTCTREGCNAVGEALGHLNKVPTCTESGGCYREGCDSYIPATGHLIVFTDEIPCNEVQIGCGNFGCSEEYKGTKHSTSTNWKLNENQHWEECQDCGEKIEGTEETHYISGGEGTDNSDGTHTGNCKVCSEPYTEVHRDEDNNNECDICEATLNSGTTHTHTGGTHANGGKCTVEGCGVVYQNHSKSTTVKDYIKETATGHTPVYGCTYSECTGTYEGTAEAHKDEDSNNKCDLCDYTMSSGVTIPECEHTNTTWGRTETEHWEVCIACGEEKPGTRKAHSYTNGKCECGRLENTDSCNHTNTTWGRTATEHWEVCIDCGKEISGTRTSHKYTNGKCECGRLEDSTTCEHKNKEWKSNKDEHWQVCKDCGEEIEGTRDNHTYDEDKCKDCGTDKDSTTSGKDIPDTGSKTVVVGIVSIIAIMGMSIIGIKKYKGI